MRTTHTGTATLLVAFSCLATLILMTAAKELPKPTEEEENSRIAPDHMRCDACAGALFHIWWKLKKAHKGNFQRVLKESEVLEIVDDACMPRTFATTYGTKEVDGVHHLSGDGLKWFSVQSPTVGTLQPGMWLTDSCRKIQGEVEEDRLYSMFRIYHVQMGLEKSDVAMFRHVCVKLLNQCTPEQGLATFDGYEEADNKVELQDLD